MIFQSRRWYIGLLMPCLMVASISVAADDEDPQMDALKDIQTVVGEWEGSGNSDASKGWDEKIDCAWKFNKNGKVSLYFTFADDEEGKKTGRLIDEAMITFDPEEKKYVFLAYKAGSDELLRFTEESHTDTNLVFDRDGKKDSSDKLDRLDIKILNDGDRLVYTFHRRIGRSRVYRPFAMVGLNRKGVSLAASADNGPKCIVTGGAGSMTVSYMGQTYYVCCSGCRATFLDNPEKFVAKAKK